MAAIKCPECECFINSFQLKDDNCWSCGGDISVLKTIVEDNKSNEDTTDEINENIICLLYTSPSPRDLSTSRMPSSA